MKAGAILYAKDYLKLSQFYQRVLGMELMEEDDEHVRLELTSSELVILQAPQHIADAILISKPPEPRTQNPVKIVYYISDIAMVRQLAEKLDGNVYAPETEWVFRLSTVCDGYDCEGNIFQLRVLDINKNTDENKDKNII